MALKETFKKYNQEDSYRGGKAYLSVHPDIS